MKALASSEVIAAAPEDRELYSVWTEGGDEAAIAYLEGLEAGFTSEQIQVMIDDMKAVLKVRIYTKLD